MKRTTLLLRRRPAGRGIVVFSPAPGSLPRWGGACSGTIPICTLAIAKDNSVQANFNE